MNSESLPDPQKETLVKIVDFSSPIVGYFAQKCLNDVAFAHVKILYYVTSEGVVKRNFIKALCDVSSC